MTSRAIKSKENRIKKVYGISLADYDRRKASQDCCCYMCGISEDSLSYSLALDHNHTTGELRKFLCNRCNKVVGIFESNDGVAALAWQYLDDHLSGKV